jgi:hypothetical protein
MIELTDAQFEVMNRICQVECMDHSEYVQGDVISCLESNIDLTFKYGHTERKELLAKLEEGKKE